MKNLCVSEVTVSQLKLPNNEDFIVCHGHEEDSSSTEIYICSHNLSLSKFDENGEKKWSQDLPVGDTDNSPVDVTFLSLPSVLCVGLCNGELFTISHDGSNCDLAGACDTGLLAMQWSPDQELLVLVTKDMKTILMSCMFDPIHEAKLFDTEFGEQEFITVGWGKKETQFHGSEGKQAAKVKNEVSVDSNSDNDNSIKISWRGDGQLYAIGYSAEGIRRFKVFDREGHLQFTSEKQQGLEKNLSWRPSGNVIATTQKIKDEYVIAFFEKNGLKHGGFTISVNDSTRVEDIAWSSDSEVIALLCSDSVNNTQNILLFTTGNYHWYLKQTLTFNSQNVVSKIIWDSDFDVANNKKLHVILKDGQTHSYTWIWEINHSNGKNDNDDAIVAVIDGKKILLTGFRQTVVPPPMAALEIELDTFANSIHFANGDGINSNSFFIFTTDNKLVFYDQISKFPIQYKVVKEILLEKNSFPLENYNWNWVNADTLICVQIANGNYSVLQYGITLEKLELQCETLIPDAVIRIETHPDDSSVLYLLLNSGEMVEYKLGKGISPLDASFPSACPKFSVLSFDKVPHYLGLSHKGNLYLDGDLIMNSVSSFFVHSHFLLLTTLKHVLLCTELTIDGFNALKEHQKKESAHVYSRKIERGAKLVIAVPNDTRTVFQLPRGNLEAIQPRPLSLKIIGEYLDNLKYQEAFDLMRKQRINLNLIYDHNPEKFLEHVDIFLESIKNNSWLSLFLSDLENVDVTKTMYSSSYSNRNHVKDGVDLKVDKICDVIRTHLAKREDSDSKILPLLTTFVKTNSDADLEKALNVIKLLKEQESFGSKLPVGSDEALKYLLYMVDVNRMFDVALGMYEFELVLLVANKSQKDPKEFIPMLNELNDMEENFKRFSVNKHLKRYDKAVECLAKCGPLKHDELTTFVKYHSLYNKALELFDFHEDIYKQISEDFGSYLTLKKQFMEAGIIYRRAKSYDKAIECFKEALEWEFAIELAFKWPKEKFQQLCWDLIIGLKEAKRYKEALTILEQYYGNNEETISCAIESGQYRTALRLCCQHNREDYKESHILPAVHTEYIYYKELIETSWSTFIKHRERLLIVRENKRSQPVEIYDPAYANKDSDLYSDAGSTLASTSSRSSSRTFRSSKNRRKHERKVASLKEGSQYEDVALVMALHGLVSSSFDLRLPLREVNVALRCFGKDQDAFVLQTSLEKLLKEMKDSFRVIWSHELMLEATNAAVAASNVPEGCSVIPQGIATLDPHLQIAPVIEEVTWKLDGLS